jgi:nucleoid-associated protein YgaU
MAETPAPAARSLGLRPAILIGAGVACVLVVAVLGLRGPPDIDAPKPPTPAQQTKPEAGRLAPSFDIVRVNPSGDTVIAGRAAPGVEVIVRQGGKEIGRTHADGRGEWVFLPSEPLPSGARELTLSALAADGSEIAGTGSVVLVVPERLAPGAVPGIALPQAPLAVLTDATAAPRVLQGASGGGKPQGDASSGKLGLEAVEYDDKGQLRFAGTAPAGAHVRVRIDNRAAGDAIADARGVWSLVPSAPVAPGAHRLHLDQIGSDGKVADRAEYPFQRETLAEKDLPEGDVMVRPGNSLWMLARSRYGEGNRYTVIYDANRARLTDPDKIYPGQILSLPPAGTGTVSAAAPQPGTAPVSSSQSR